MENKQHCENADEAREMVREAHKNKIADQVWLHDNVPGRLVAYILTEIARSAQQELTSNGFSWHPAGLFHHAVQTTPDVHRFPCTEGFVRACTAAMDEIALRVSRDLTQRGFIVFVEVLKPTESSSPSVKARLTVDVSW